MFLLMRYSIIQFSCTWARVLTKLGFLCQAPQVFVLCGGPFDAKGAWADSISGCPYSLVTSDLSDNEKAS